LNLADFFDPDLIISDLKVNSKIEAVEHLADLFCKKYPDKNRQAILQAVAEREELGSTSFGRGFAFPHARTGSVSDLYIAIAIVKDGVGDKTPDNIPIKVICLLLTPRNISKLYLQVLSGLANFARRTGILNRIDAIKSSEDMIELIRGSGIEVKTGITVADLMSRDIVTVSPDDPLKQVANIMFKHNFDGVPVVDSAGKLMGDVSCQELIKWALPDYEKLLSQKSDLEPFEELLRRVDFMKVRDIINANVVTISETATLLEASMIIVNKKIDRIMVVREGKLVGVIAASDIVSKIIRG
jgi:mannitol/fructose-specific phosphotransferase system IIA component (Ntr-type)